MSKYELLKKEEQEKQQQEESKHVDNKKVDDSKAFSEIRNDEELSSAFKLAVAAAVTGSFRKLSELKDQGYMLSSKEIEELKALKKSDPKTYIAVQTIFGIALGDPACSPKLPGSNKNEVKQLSLNF